MRGYERALIEYSPSKDSWHGLRCAGGTIRRFDLSQEFWHYAISGKTRLGVLARAAHANTTVHTNIKVSPHDYDDSSDEDEDFYDARRRIRSAINTTTSHHDHHSISNGASSEDAKSETHDNDMDDLGTLTLQLDLSDDDNGIDNNGKKCSSTVRAKLSVKKASPSARASIVAGISVLRSMISGMSLSFKKPNGSSKVG